MNVSDVFSTSQRIKILKKVIFETDSIQVSDVARETSTSKGLVSKYLNGLVGEGVLTKDADRFHVLEGPETKAIRIFFNLLSMDRGLFGEFSFIKSAGVYGSMVRGTNTRDSDIDLWIFHEPVGPEELSRVSRKLSGMGDVKPLYLSKERIEYMRINDPVFYYSLIFGSITLYGEPLDAV
jgi:predicted nucleotidyltransferase